MKEETPPYRFRKVGSHFFTPHEYEILFEDSPIKTLTCYEELISEIVFLLNTAWTLGLHTGIASTI